VFSRPFLFVISERINLLLSSAFLNCSKIEVGDICFFLRQEYAEYWQNCTHGIHNTKFVLFLTSF